MNFLVLVEKITKFSMSLAFKAFFPIFKDTLKKLFYFSVDYNS